MPYGDVLVHRAIPFVRAETGGEVVEGEDSGAGHDVRGTAFACCLFLPDGTEQAAGGRSRRVKRPTLLISPVDELGAPVAVSHEDELLIVAPELNAAEGLPADAEVRYQVQGSGQPFGRPGFAIIGKQLTLSRVEETDPQTAVLEEAE
ncbi:MAG TPA: hypothetical protein VF192_01295 [Longimicrobiales bacterium]